jgi:glycosyltransferase involved in cell wall biosynthesis
VRVALVTQHFAPHFEGGTEAVVRAQARELAARGHDVHVVSGTDRPFAAGENGTSSAHVDGLRVDFLHRRPDEPYDLILERPRLTRRVAALCADDDLVHVHHWTTLDNSLVRELSAGGRPVVVSLHDHFTSCPRFFRIPAPGSGATCPGPGDIEPCVACCGVEAPLPADELAAGLAARARTFGAELAAAAALIAPSRAHARALADALGPEIGGRLEVVPHGLGAPLERCAPPRAVPPLRVLHLGHRSHVKGTLDLVQAIAGLPEERRAQVWLLCLGAEVERGFDDVLRDAAPRAPGAQVVLEGAYDVAALSSILSARGGAHVAAFPSRAPESYGLVVDEALALGVPCLVSDRGALPERVGAAGRVLPPADPAAWTRALSELLDAPETLERWRAALPPGASAGAPTAAQAAEALEALYHRLLAQRAPLRPT